MLMKHEFAFNNIFSRSNTFCILDDQFLRPLIKVHEIGSISAGTFKAFLSPINETVLNRNKAIHDLLLQPAN